MSNLIFERVRWKNLLSTGNIFTEINLTEANQTLVVGENGAGKSTMIEAIFYAMFGKPFRRINKPQLVNSINQKGLLVELEFSIASKKYLIRRGIKPNLFEIYSDGTLINQDASIKDYQVHLEKNILKLNHRSASQIIILGSRSFVPFMQLPAQHRREVIEDLLDLQIFSSMNVLLKQKIADNKSELRDVKYDADLIQEKIRLQKEYIKNLKNNNDKQIEAHNLKIKNLEEDNDNANIKIGDLLDSMSELSPFIGENEAVESKIKKFDSLNIKLASKINSINKELSFYTNHDDCPTCKQKLDPDFKESMKSDKATNLKECTEAKAEIDAVISDLETKQTELKIELAKIEKCANQIASIRDTVSLNNKMIASIKSDIHRLSTEESKDYDETALNKLKSDLNECVKRHEKLISEKSIYDIVAVLLKDGGIKSKIIKQYIPIMNKLINKYLAAMEMSCSFELDENFNEVVKSRYRDEFSYDSFSEGEKARLDLAILFAWRNISKLRNGNSSNLLILDETFDGSLDAQGTEDLMKILGVIDGDSNIFVISHRGESMVDKFNSIIRFEKIKNFSRISVQ
jgi:DNA repair exonuclease SbcCD ATPase subunit